MLSVVSGAYLLIIFLGKMIVQIFCPCFIGMCIFLVLHFESSLYNLDTSPLSGMCFANTFSLSVACLCILLTLSLKEEKIFTLRKSNLSLYSGMDYA